MKKYSVITISLFLAMIVFFTSFSVFGKKSEFSEKENRALQTFPEISLEAIGDGTFQEEYDAYLADQFEFRDFWVKARSNVLLRLGRKDINGVYFGSEGYLVEKYTEDDFDSESVQLNVETLASFLNRNAQAGLDVTAAFVPSKAGVLKNRMPSGAEPYDTSEIASDVYAGLSDKVNKVDLYLPLEAHSNEYIYYKTDHHWTSLGAYYAYRALAEKMNFSAVDISSLKSETVSDGFLGSTYDKVQLEAEPDSIVAYAPSVKVKVNYNGEKENSDSLFDSSAIQTKSKYDYFLGGNFARIDLETNADNNETLIILKDSFANSIIPFLVNNYKHIIMLDLRFLEGDVQNIIDTENPDKLLVLYNVEKFMGDANQVKLEARSEAAASDTGDSEEDAEILAELEREEAQG